MSVEYYTCNNCGETFSDYGYYVSCEDCETKWCCDKCAKEDGYIEEHCKKYNVYGYHDLDDEREIRGCEYSYCNNCPEYVPDSCKYCRNEDYDDLTLLNKALELLHMSREELVEVYNSDTKGNNVNNIIKTG